VTVYSRYNRPPPVRVDASPGEKNRDRAKQSFKGECDINRIMGKYLKSGTVDHFTRHGGTYGFASSATFHDAMNVVVKAEKMFSDLPSDIRKKFANDPAAFLEFVQDEKNLPEMRKLGLAPEAPSSSSPAPEPAPTPAPAPPAPPAPTQ